MTCKDCIHSDVCEGIFDCFDVRMPYRDNETCAIYKDKSRFIELPCKVGTRVYSLSCACNEWEHGRCDSARCYGDMDAPCYKHSDVIFCDEFSLSDLHNFGKTVFLTREEAEKKLEELQ